MQTLGWEIVSNQDGYDVHNMLFTYSEEEQEENRIAKNNAALVLKPKFIPMYPELLKQGYSMMEALILWFIDFFLQNNERFYCTNEQLSELFYCSEPTISTAIKNLERRWDIKLHKKMKAGWGTVRFLTLENQKIWFWEIKKVDWIYNKIIDNNLSISNDIDNISYPQEKISRSIKQKTNITPKEQTPLPGPLPEPVESFLKDSYEKFPSIKYQIDKQKSKYFLTTIKDFEKLCQEYWKDTVYLVLEYIKQDEFRNKQIQSISKLRKKNKDWVPYMVVMLEKIQNYKPKVIDLDQYK